tara:strand:- start:202 stop:477 length:276 start_codon:yes stop_codon:yes gene_type:complete
MKQKCPNCNEFEYSKDMSTRGCGFRLLIGVPLFVIFSLMWAGGAVDPFWFTLSIIVSVIIGSLVIIISFISPQKTIKWSCSKCKFEQKHHM